MGKTPQIKKLEGAIHGLERELDQLAPCPGPHFPSPASLITKSFNRSSTAWQIYLRDLPHRLGLERQIAARWRQLNFLSYSYMEAPAPAA